MREQQFPLETLLQQAVPEAFRRRIAALPAEEVLQKQYDFSSLDRRIRAALKKLQKERRKQAAPKGASLRTAKRIALVAALLAALFGGTLVASAQLRAYVKEIIVEWTQRNVGIRYEVEGHQLTELPAGYGPHYIPEGFVYVPEQSYEFAEAFEKYYENEEGYFILIEANTANNMSGASIDNEHITYETVDFGETDAYFGTFDDGGGYVMNWYADGIEHSIYINAYLSKSEVYAIAENIY